MWGIQCGEAGLCMVSTGDSKACYSLRATISAQFHGFHGEKTAN